MGADDDALPAEVVLRADVEVQENPYKTYARTSCQMDLSDF